MRRGARRHFQSCLILAPETEQRPAVEARITELNRRIEREQMLVTPTVTDAGADETEEEAPKTQDAEALPPRNVAPLVVMGGGALVALASIPFGVASNNAEERAAEASTHREGAAELVTARRYATLTNVLWVSGGVLMLGGLIWALAKPRKSESPVSFDGTLRVPF